MSLILKKNFVIFVLLREFYIPCHWEEYRVVKKYSQTAPALIHTGGGCGGATGSRGATRCASAM